VAEAALSFQSVSFTSKLVWVALQSGILVFGKCWCMGSISGET